MKIMGDADEFRRAILWHLSVKVEGAPAQYDYWVWHIEGNEKVLLKNATIGGVEYVDINRVYIEPYGVRYTMKEILTRLGYKDEDS